MLRDYQQEAFEATINHISSCLDSCVIEAATGAGKSHIIAAIAEWINNKTGRKVLCLAPAKELVEQNREKYLLTGNPASMWSASAGEKSMVHDVIFGSPLSVKNSIEKFGKQFSAVIVDEAHGITPTVKLIIDHIKTQNHRLRVIGCSATPFRMNTGYIYEHDENNKFVEQARDPFFKKLLCRITARYLIDRGYLTKPTTEVTDHHYNTDGLKLNSMGNFSASSVEQAFEGKGRLTSEIVADIIDKSRMRKGVMIFASTVQHAQEIMGSLPSELSAMVTGDTPRKERESIINRFKHQEIKYLVSVSTLTTGFDCSHVDVVAILRATESPGLLQQIVGRGLRLHEDKEDCLILDYAGNVERHGLEDDLFNPDIKAGAEKKEGVPIEATCPICKFTNDFNRRNDDAYLDLQYDENGYFIDLEGNRIVTDQGEVPAHYGRRCFGGDLKGEHWERCDYRWTSKECPDCGEDNDIAARYCSHCKCEIIDPNEKLQLEFKRIKEDPYTLSTDKVLTWRPQKWQTTAGNTTLKVEYTTEYNSFAIWYRPNSRSSRDQALWHNLSQVVFGKGRIAPSVEKFIEHWKKGKMPETITVKRDKGSKFFKVFAHNKPEDNRPNEIPR